MVLAKDCRSRQPVTRIAGACESLHTHRLGRSCLSRDFVAGVRSRHHRDITCAPPTAAGRRADRFPGSGRRRNSRRQAPGTTHRPSTTPRRHSGLSTRVSELKVDTRRDRDGPCRGSSTTPSLTPRLRQSSPSPSTKYQSSFTVLCRTGLEVAPARRVVPHVPIRECSELPDLCRARGDVMWLRRQILRMPLLPATNLQASLGNPTLTGLRAR